MTLFEALIYFFREAALSLGRSWKASAIAIMTMGLSLFMGGFFFLVSVNLARTLEQWRGQLRIVFYLTENLSEQQMADLATQVRQAPFVREVDRVSSAEALERFSRSFPGLADLLQDWEEVPFPPSVEAAIDPRAVAPGELDSWLELLRGNPAIELVDDDRAWLLRLSRLLAILRSVGIVVVAGLLIASALTIASVVKLTAYLYVEEIAVMRLVGATEFFIRGPFYVEGLLQGLFGGSLALVALYLASRGALAAGGESPYLPLLFDRFLSWRSMSTLVLVGGLAGLLGAISSLRRESLKLEASD